MGKFKTLAIDLDEYQDEIHDLLNRMDVYHSAGLKYAFLEGLSFDEIEAALSWYIGVDPESVKILEIAVAAIAMNQIDRKTLKVIPLDLTLEFTNDINI